MTASPIEVAVDSSVLCALLLQEPGWQTIRGFLARPDVAVMLAGPVLTEAIEVTRRKGNQSSADQLHQTIQAQGMRVEHPTDDDLVRAAELLELSKGNPGPPHPRSSLPVTLSLGDSLILAIAERCGASVLTRDKYWKWMVDQNLLKLRVVIP